MKAIDNLLPSSLSRLPDTTSTMSVIDTVNVSLDAPQSQHGRDKRTSLTFMDLPLEVREIIWRFALPERRVFKALVWASTALKMQLLNRSELKMPLAHVCFEARRIVNESGYVLAFRDEDEPDDTGVWFHPKRDHIDRTIWGPGDWNAGV
ncbi:hypothetical protein NPX13_g7182 [Xylaria arbuscula]|uniref:2EXR domain-containing protein n=1 Tax=Xylaria arbuscula TaxID=114810 RepID=A0A9W8NAT9_9PEZI|nr:hypothetical protein NPX13_g7182 [Xylaria arbuscula]